MNYNDVALLEVIMKKNCPVDTGTLKNYGIQSAQLIPGGWRLIAGVNNDFMGKNPSKYVYATEYGAPNWKRHPNGYQWIKRSIQEWAPLMVQKYGRR